MTTAASLRVVFGSLLVLAGVVGLLAASWMRRRGVQPGRSDWRVWALGWVLVVCGSVQVVVALLVL